METYTEKIGNKLNELLEKTFDAEKGYEKAASNANNQGLKLYFERKAQERYNFGHALKNEIEAYGQEPEKGDSVTSKVHRAWMDVKGFLSTDNDEAMLEEAIRGDKAAIEDYNDVLGDNSLPLSTENLLVEQKNKIQNVLNHIKTLEDLA